MKRFFKNLAGGFAAYCAVIMGFVVYGVRNLPNQYSLAAGGMAELPFFFTLGSEESVNTAEGAVYTYTARVEALGIVPVKDVSVSVSRRQYVNIGGDIIGIKMYTDGVIVVNVDKVSTAGGSVSPGTKAGLRVGDIITKVNGRPLNSSEALSALIEKSGGRDMVLDVTRGTGEYQFTLHPALSRQGVYRAGVWVRDSSAGVGTVTFTRPETGTFAALGHAVCDVDTGELMPLAKGAVVEAGIKGIYKGSRDGPGELCGVFNGTSVGTITRNTDEGLFGEFSESRYFGGQTVPVGMADEVKTGKAYIIATLDDGGPRAYSAEITKIYSAADTANRNMVITVTDDDLIAKAGGIVQGMSGSPIVQNGMLMGAITHVFVNDPTKGYGIFAENMIEDTAA